MFSRADNACYTQLLWPDIESTLTHPFAFVIQALANIDQTSNPDTMTMQEAAKEDN